MRLLILGTGWMAEQHATQFGKIEGVELIGAVDIERARSTNFRIATAFPIASRHLSKRWHGTSLTRRQT